MGRRRWPAGRAAEVEAAYGRKCWLCWQSIASDETVSLDHVRPDVYGGTDDVDNLRPAHGWCNRQRGEWDVTSYYAWALASGRDPLVPEALRPALRPIATARAAQARLYYARSTRGTALPPLAGSWELVLPS